MWSIWGLFGLTPPVLVSTLVRRKDQVLVLSYQALHLAGPDSLMLFMGPGSIKAWTCVVRGGSLTRQDDPRALWNCSAGSGGRGTTIHPVICPSIYSSIHCLFNTYCLLDACQH